MGAMPTSETQANRMTKLRGLALAALSLSTLGVACSSSPTADENAPVDTPFVVSDYFAPSGFMGDGKTVGSVVACLFAVCLGHLAASDLTQMKGS